MLSGFLSDLGIISTDMKRLKEQSVVINHQLNNRQKVRGELSQFVDDMVVPHIMIKLVVFSCMKMLFLEIFNYDIRL